MKWQQLPETVAWNPEHFAETLNGGQAFRWNPAPDGTWEGIFGPHHAFLRINSNHYLEAAFLSPSDPLDLAHYLDLFTDYPCRIHDLPWRSDPVLNHLKQRWGGLHLLRQPLEETLLAFLCSSTKQIPQIKIMCERMAESLGEPIPGSPKRQLPTWPQLAKTPETVLRECGLGYRARYVSAIADVLSTQPQFFETLRAGNYRQAKTQLCSLPGVGEKIADCVLLFGDARWEAFPVDTWIEKTLIRYYGLKGWKKEQLAQFARIHFGAYAGLAQQWMFAEGRRTKKSAG